MKSLYVDDFIGGEDTVDQGYELKGVAISIFKGAGFELHKCGTLMCQDWKQHS